MKIKQIILCIVFALTLVTVPVVAALTPDAEISTSERRPLIQFDDYGTKRDEALLHGNEYGLTDYFSYLEDYLLDQFPVRDGFRSIKTLTKLYMLGLRDNNDYYYVDGTLAKLDSVRSDKALADALARFNSVYDKYFANTDANVYYSVIPDKNYFTASQNGYPSYDYDAFYRDVRAGLYDGFKEIDIKNLLDIGDYYRTDPHWSQPEILDIADALLYGMSAEGTASGQSYTRVDLSPFYGTYYGQAALPVKPDTMSYLTNDIISGAEVYDYEKDTVSTVYTDGNFSHTDPYDVYLSGAKPLLKITNPAQDNGRQLVLFRDSFGSSIAPLFISEYSEIIIVDIRYISPQIIDMFVKFDSDCDALFLYSTSVINSIGAFMK